MVETQYFSKVGSARSLYKSVYEKGLIILKGLKHNQETFLEIKLLLYLV